MSPADIAVIAIIGLSALLAFARGFLREVLSIASWIGAAVVAYIAFPHAQPHVRAQIAEPLMADIATGAALFIVALIVFSIASFYLGKLVRGGALTAADRGLGVLFGLLRGAVLVSLAYLLIMWIFQDEETPVWIKEARSAPWVERGAQLLRDLVPEDVVAEHLGQLDETRQRLNAGVEEAGQALGSAVDLGTELEPDSTPPSSTKPIGSGTGASTPHPTQRRPPIARGVPQP